MRIRYGAWSGTQDPFPHAVSADEVLSELSDDLLAGLSPEEALENLLRRGMTSRGGSPAGLEDLRRRVAEARAREAQRMGVDGPLAGAQARLDQILSAERASLAGDDSDAARLSELALDDLPPGIAGRIAALEDRDWHDAQAGADFRALVDELRAGVADATFGRLAGAMGAMGPEDRARMADLLAELNGLMERNERGEDISADFADFAQRHADLLPGDPQTLDELLEDLARRAAAASAMMAGMSPEQRAELAQMAADLMGDDADLAFESARFSDALQRRFPGLGWGQAPEGAEPGGAAGAMGQTLDWVEHLRELDDLAESLGQDYPGARLEDIDTEALGDVLGPDAARDLAALREIERALEEAGAAQRTHGRLELTPRGVRKLGEASLARIYARAVTGGVGSHRASGAGGDGELTGTTRALRFGDPFRLDVGRTMRNALVRRAGEADDGRGLTLVPDDFELAEAERRVRAATVLLLDMSFSMPLRGNWVPAKRMALALSSLISSQFPEDRFYVVGFSDYARELRTQDLLVSGWERVYGTNMQHAFMIARRLLGAHPEATQQVIMVTDGEPTAHLEGDTPYFAWPPEPKTLRMTLAEASRLARTGATLNVFLLDHDPGAAAFIEHMVSRYGGRIFYPDLDDLGSMVVRDFLDRRA